MIHCVDAHEEFLLEKNVYSFQARSKVKDGINGEFHTGNAPGYFIQKEFKAIPEINFGKLLQMNKNSRRDLSICDDEVILMRKCALYLQNKSF